MITFYTLQIEGNSAHLLGQEAKHCVKVLRHQVGDTIQLTDGKGRLYKGVIASFTKSVVEVERLEVIDEQPTPRIKAIAIAPTKLATKIEWFLEKATEIGITDVYPIYTKRTERDKLKYERLEGIILSAMKQSGNLHLPTLHELAKYPSFIQSCAIEHKYIAHCMDADQHLLKLHQGGDAIVLIGPEGDFTVEEVDMARANDWVECNLGASRLRTETAGIVACHLLNL